MNRNLLALALLVGLSASPAWADENVPDELTMKTDVGVVSLRTEDCPIKNTYGFLYVANATDTSNIAQTGKIENHAGCWYKVPGMVYIWFYNEPDAPVASYRDHLFGVGK